MVTLTNSTFKSVSASIGLHLLFIVLGSLIFYNNTIQTLELTGKSGTGKRSISLSGINFIGKKVATQRAKSNVPKKNTKVIATSVSNKTMATTTTDAVTVSSANNGVQQESDGSGDGPISGKGTGIGDFDKGHLFGQIKNFFESRLGSTLNIRENQLIKIKVILSQEGEILDAILIQGKLDMSVLRRVISVAKNIPLKSYWKTNTYPHELIIPLILTPS